MGKNSGLNYAPKASISKIDDKINYYIAAVGIDHGHIYGMIEGLTSAGAILKYIVDVNGLNNQTLENLKNDYPSAQVVSDINIVLDDEEINLVCSSTINSERAEIAINAMKAGKDAFLDKPAITSLEAYSNIERVIESTGKKLYIYYGELIHNECALYAQEQIKNGRIGKVIQVLGTGPHREGGIGSRYDWFYEPEKFGGILTDIGSHQVAQYLAFSGAKTANIKFSHVGNYAHPKQKSFQDFGEVSLIGDNKTSGYFRVDWFTPTGLSTWSDSRIMIIGTTGTIELRKYCDIAIAKHGENNVYIATEKGEEYINVTGMVGFDYFKLLIEDSIDKTLELLNQREILEPTKIALIAQKQAEIIGWENESS